MSLPPAPPTPRSRSGGALAAQLRARRGGSRTDPTTVPEVPARRAPAGGRAGRAPGTPDQTASRRSAGFTLRPHRSRSQFGPVGTGPHAEKRRSGEAERCCLLRSSAAPLLCERGSRAPRQPFVGDLGLGPPPRSPRSPRSPRVLLRTDPRDASHPSSPRLRAGGLKDVRGLDAGDAGALGTRGAALDQKPVRTGGNGASRGEAEGRAEACCLLRSSAAPLLRVRCSRALFNPEEGSRSRRLPVLTPQQPSRPSISGSSF